MGVVVVAVDAVAVVETGGVVDGAATDGLLR